MEKNHKMQGQNSDMGMTYLDRMALRAAEGAKDVISVEAARCKAMLSAGGVPEVCGPDIAPSPARGGFVLVQNVELLPVGTKDVEAVHRGYGGREAIRRADPFDAMIAAAVRRRQPWPLTPGQIAIGRRYHDLVEMLSADGTKLSSLQGSAGGPDGRDWMDRRLELSAEVDQLRSRIGTGVAMSVRRIRPSDRGADGRRLFLTRELVDAVCISGKGIKQALTAFGWQADGRNCKTALAALSGALDAMIGYGRKKSY